MKKQQHPGIKALRQQAKGLQEVARYLETHPDLAERFNPSPTPPTVNIFTNDSEQFGQLAASLGSFEKKSVGEFIYLSRSFSGNVCLDVNAHHEEVCERVVVGTKQVEAPDPNAPKITTTEEVVEWRCPPSVLALAAKA